MERKSGRVWAWRALFGLVIGLIVVTGAMAWRFTDVVASEFLAPVPTEPVEVEVLEVAAGRVVLADSEAAARPGIWGLSGPEAYGQLTSIVSRADGRVERGLVMLLGEFRAGDIVAIDPNAFPSDPRTGLGVPYEEIRVPGDLGVNPAWLLAGENDTWVVFVHGRGSGRSEALRTLATYRKLGFPVLVITYRNDDDGGIRDGSPVTWGLDEWRDLEVALDSARLRGARDFILAGHDMGAAIVIAWLHESPSIGDVRGVILDSPTLDLEALVDAEAEARGFPGFITSIGKDITRIRFGLEWGKLDQLERAEEFDPSIPVLLIAGSDDAITPISSADEFSAALPNVLYLRVEGATHTAAWNLDPVGYEEVLTAYLVDIRPGLELEP